MPILEPGMSGPIQLVTIPGGARPGHRDVMLAELSIMLEDSFSLV